MPIVQLLASMTGAYKAPAGTVYWISPRMAAKFLEDGVCKLADDVTDQLLDVALKTTDSESLKAQVYRGFKKD